MGKNFHPVDPKVDFVRQEHELLKWWQDQNIFQQLRTKNEGRPRWSFLDGPITANNPMGVHHAWGRTYKDIFLRYHAMKGFELRYQNGFDCQGLWVEVEVERELGFTSKRDIEAYGIEAFVNRCKERVLKYARQQTEQSIRLGYWMDWDHSYFTMSDENNYTIWGFLKEVHERGWLRKGKDAMPWCPRCGTGISQHEMTEGYKEIDDKSVYLLLPLVDRENAYLVVWTTTPWTLSANVAAAVSEELEYVVIEDHGRQLYLLPEAIPRIFGRKAKPEVLEHLHGTDLLGWRYRGPFDEFPAQAGVEHKIIPWDEVSADEGSGIVHIAPGCGKEDFDLGRKHGLPVIAPLDENGVYMAGFDWLTGRPVDEVTAPIVDHLKEQGLLLHQANYVHRYPHCWRCKTKLVFRVVTEWYITMDGQPAGKGNAAANGGLRHQIMDVARQIEWMPSYGLDRELDWLTNMDDWMISKKRYWGLALPIYECAGCGTVTVVGSREELQERAIEGWEQFDGQSPHRPWIDAVKIACPHCGATVPRILDVGTPWLDAGIVPFSTLHYRDDRDYWERWFPADFITESLPGQFRNWFYSLLAMSTVLENRPPFKRVLGHALVKDEHGKDMHKSDGNAIWFDEAAEKMGVDVMRWLYASQNPDQNLLFGYHHADGVRKKPLTLWNSYSFFVTYASLDKFNPVRDTVPVEHRAEIDRWLIARTHKLIIRAGSYYDDYRVDKLMLQVEGYIDDLSNWYIRRNRRRFWKSDNDQDKMAAFSSLHEALVTLVKVLAPIIPFVTESIYRNLVCSVDSGAPESVHMCAFPEADDSMVDEDLIRDIGAVVQIVSLGRAAREKAKIRVRQPLSRLVVFGSKHVRLAVTKYADQIMEELNVKEVIPSERFNAFADKEINLNREVLGPKYGQLLPLIDARLRELIDAGGIPEDWRGTQPLPSLLVDGTPIELQPEEVHFQYLARKPFEIAHSKSVLVGINTELTTELIEEGTVRDLIRQVQNMRKEVALSVEQRIVVGVSGNEHVERSLARFQDTFLAAVLGTRLYPKLDQPEHEKVVNLGGAEVSIHIARA